MKIYLRALMYIGIGIFGSILILTILHYFNLISDNIVDILKVAIAIISIIVGGVIAGRDSQKKGWLTGIKLSGLIIALFFLITLIFRLGLSYKLLIYYAIIIVASMIGGMIGISSRQKK